MMLLSHFYGIAITLRPQVPLLQYCYYITTTSASHTLLHQPHMTFASVMVVYPLLLIAFI